MTTLTKEYFEQHLEETLDKRLEATTRAILGVVEQRFEALDARMSQFEHNLASLTSSVDRFVKLFSDQNQEIIVLRKQLKEVEERVEKLELKLHSA